MTTELKIYRRSELEAISDGCLHRYKAIWIDGVDDTSDIALIGQGFARVKHNYIERLVSQGLASDAEEAQAAFIEGAALAHIPARLIPDLKWLWDFHAERFDLPLDRFVAAEERGSAGGVGFTPDLVLAHPEENSLEIIDDKSGFQPPITEAELKGLFQARVYSAYGKMRWPGFSKYYFTISAVRFNKKTTVSFTPAELDAVEVEIAAAIATIEHAKVVNEWPAIPGPSCRFCTLACPIADEKLLMPKRLSVEQMQKLGAWLLPADKQMRAFKKLMKQACSEYGPCDIGGVVWDNRPTISRTYPIEAVMKVLQELKIDTQAAEVRAMGGDLTLSHSALAKLMKTYPEIEQKLAGVVQSKTGYRFSARKPGDEDDDEG